MVGRFMPAVFKISATSACWWQLPRARTSSNILSPFGISTLSRGHDDADVPAARAVPRSTTESMRSSMHLVHRTTAFGGRDVIAGPRVGDGPACTRRQRPRHSRSPALAYRSPVLTFVGDGPGSAGGSRRRPGPPPRAGASSGYTQPGEVLPACGKVPRGAVT